MKTLLPIMMISCCTNQMLAQTSQSLQVEEHVLSNGLTVWLNEDHSQPKVFGAVLVKAGAKDSPNTGIAHYFEHIMFKGTNKIGTINYAAEKVLLDSIAARYDELATTKDVKERALIQQAINELSVKASEYVIPNEFDHLISKYGGTKLNAGTSYDFTVYFNTFSPQYIEQWAELNSERLLNPVFRLFQSELETVYEEKNMYSDALGSQAVERLLERYFSPHPYAYPIIGSTENLKNPRLSEMKKFFETYYVASNMGLMLSGDFDKETVLPILEKTFSRIPNRQLPDKPVVKIPPFQGREKFQVKFPIPFVKAMGFGFRGVPANHKDQVALNIAVALLNNTNGTGFLDKLMVNHKLMSSMAINQSLNEAGILGVLVVPKLFFQTYSGAEALVWNEINRIKEGDFSDEFFESLKLEQKREYTSSLEDISSRTQVMMKIYSQGKSWKEYMEEVVHIDNLTKEDVIAAAKTYFSDNYLYVTKKTGKYPKDNLPKPNLKPITPKNTNASSEYARQLELLPKQALKPRFINFEKDVTAQQLNSLCTLYVTPNAVNDIFTLKISYGVGNIEYPILSHLEYYLSLVGTHTMSFEVFRSKLQVLGSTLSFEAKSTDFVIKVSGFDNRFNETVALVGEFMEQTEENDKKIKKIVEDAKVSKKAFFKSSENMAQALLEKVKHGENSRYLTKLSLQEVKKLKSKELVGVFNRIQQVECTIHYAGTLPVEQVSACVKESIPLNKIKQESKSPYYRELITYNAPTVYFYDMPDVSQSIVYGYMKGDVLTDQKSDYAAKLFTQYFGGDMSSLMFQEIREFRSYAYRVSARYNQPVLKQFDKPGCFITMLSTQGDKTVEALSVLDSLITKMPVRAERIAAIKQSIQNHVNNDYPSFRELSVRVASLRRDGYESDPNKPFLDDVLSMDMKDISLFYEKNIQNRQVVYVIVGNSKQIDMQELASYGNIVKLKKKDFYR